jgi:3',5'-cyclic AMP phosphodiesterase CpdA
MRVLHCSDVHVTQRYRARTLVRAGWRRWIAMAEHVVGGRGRAYRDADQRLAAIASRVASGAADHLAITGDLTAYAMPDEFRNARAALETLTPGQCSIVPGNHDYFTPESAAEGRFERCFADHLVSDMPEHGREGPYPFVRLVAPDVAIVGVRSASVPAFPGIGAGAVSGLQLDGLRAIVQDPQLDGRAILVLVHHAPLRPHGSPDSLWHGLRNGHELLELMPGPRFAILHGHIHDRFHLPATAARPHLFGAGSSTRPGAEGWWVIEVTGGRVVSATLETPSVADH